MDARHLLTALLFVSVPVVARADDGGSSGPNLDRPGFELGARYWYSMGRVGYNYYGDTTTSLLMSRLTYDQLTANAGEVYVRGDLSGFFVKGIFGGGSIGGGRLLDEDFPPLTVPYSETSSSTSATLSYGAIDVGYSVVRQPSFRLGGFVGYGRWNEAITASGCKQLTTNPDICQPIPLPASIAVISETDNWNLLRVGATADLMLGEHVKLTADAAWVHAWQNAVDHHFFTVVGVDPATGNGNGFQIEAIASYQFTNSLGLGVGGRWWHLDTNAVDSFQQLLTYRTDRYGVFLQGSLRLN